MAFVGQMVKMYKCLIWGTSIVFQKSISMLELFQNEGILSVEAVTSNDGFYSSILDYRYINKKELSAHVEQFDRVIVMADGEALREISIEAVQMGFSDGDIVPYKVMGMIGFNFDIYKDLRIHTPSIIAPNCWGGITYNALGLRFRSPFINMFLNKDEYMRLISNLGHYLSKELIFDHTAYNSDIGIEYPVVKLGDVSLFFNHYKSFSEARECWEKRKQRIDWNNLFVMFFDLESCYVDDFCNLPFSKKVYFSGNHIQKECTIPIDYKRDDGKFYDFVNKCGKGQIMLYNPFELLLRGTISYISKIHEVS